MDRRFIIFIVLSVFVIYGWQFLFPSQKQTVNQNVQTEDVIEQKINKTIENKIDLSKNDQLLLKKEERYKETISKISNEHITIETTNSGAKINHIYINYLNNKKNEEPDTKIDLVKSDENNNNLSLSGLINDQKFEFDKQQWIVGKNESEVVFSVSPADNLTVYKKIIISENNLGQVVIGINNKTNRPIKISDLSLQWGPGKNKGKDHFNITKAVALVGRKVERFKAKKKFESKTVSLNEGFVGLADQYFCTLFYGNKEVMESATIYQQANQTLDIHMNLADINIAPNESKEHTLNFYFGPQNYDGLKKLGINAQKMVDFGIFRILSVPMYHTLKFFYDMTKNYGLAIILLTILIRGILWYPTHRSQTSMKKMQTAMAKMQPRLKTLKEVYKDNPQKLNEETMKLYKEYQVNPMGGCLPMLLMMPVLFAMFSIMRSAVELKGAPFIWMWQDLSLKDPTYILPIAMGLSMFIQQKISTPPAATPEAATQQKMMLYLMPVMLTFFSFMWPSGLLLYWVISNILSIGQQVIINSKKA